MAPGDADGWRGAFPGPKTLPEAPCLEHSHNTPMFHNMAGGRGTSANGRFLRRTWILKPAGSLDHRPLPATTEESFNKKQGGRTEPDTQHSLLYAQHNSLPHSLPGSYKNEKVASSLFTQQPSLDPIS